MKKLLILLSFIFVSSSLLSTSYADHYGDGLVQFCLDNPDENGCLEIICHENPDDLRCTEPIELPSTPVSAEDIENLFCEQNPDLCPFEDPFPLDLPEIDPCLADGCPYPWAIEYYGIILQQAQLTMLEKELPILDDKITQIQNNIDTLKIDTVPLPEDKLNVVIVLAGIAAAGSIGAVIVSSRRR